MGGRPSVTEIDWRMEESNWIEMISDNNNYRSAISVVNNFTVCLLNQR